MLIQLETEYVISDTVYLKTDIDQYPRIITGINIRIGNLIYLLSCGTQESYHYAFELSKDKDIMITTTN